MIKLLNISELSKKLNLINQKTKKPLNYILRYWEKEFKHVQPTKIRNRRYYSQKQVEIIKLIKFLLKDKGLTIFFVNTVLKTMINILYVYYSYILNSDYLKYNLKSKIKVLLD